MRIFIPSMSQGARRYTELKLDETTNFDINGLITLVSNDSELYKWAFPEIIVFKDSYRNAFKIHQLTLYHSPDTL